MKTQNTVVDQIAAINNNGNLNTRQKWSQILAIDIKGKRGAPEAREIQEKITQKWAAIKARINPEKNYKWVSPAQRLARLDARLSGRQYNHGFFMADYQAGSPRYVLGRDMQSAMTLRGLEQLDAGTTTQYAKIGEWIISSDEAISWDNNCYSKAWHRQHGGKKVVDYRLVMIRRLAADGSIEKRDIKIDGWRGQWALKALVESGVVAPVKVAAKLKPVQLNAAFDVRLVRTVMGISIYERTLLGEHHDYCAVAGSVTFHAGSIRAALKGLHKKTTEVQIRKNSPINWDFCKQLGFCDTGIREFCADFGINSKGSYSPDTIRDLVKADLSTAAKYENELRKVAQVLDYAI